MKIIAIKIISVLLAVVVLVAALPLSVFAEDASACSVLQCEHNYEESFFESSSYVTNEHHLTTLYCVEYCSLCGSTLNITEMDSYLESHNVEVSSDKTYLPDSDEYHITTEHIYETCICCGVEISSREIESYETHEFDASVDPEVDMEGVCVCCGEMIYW